MPTDCTRLKVGDWVAYCKYDGRISGPMLHQVKTVTPKRFTVCGDLIERATGKQIGGINSYRRPATEAEIAAFHAAHEEREKKRIAEEEYNAREDVRLARTISCTEVEQWLKLGIEELRRLAERLESL